MERPNIVVIGGGTGIFTVLSALKTRPVAITAIVSMADDGGSSGALRDQYGVLPPGDIRKALVALAGSSEALRNLFAYRFAAGDFAGHAFGNIFLSALEKTTGSFSAAVEEASRILCVRGRVIPVTLDDTRLCAELADGTVISGETNIDIPHNPNRPPIARLWLDPPAAVNPAGVAALADADLIVIGPGDLYTSIIPNLLVRGLTGAVARSPATRVFVANLMTKPGETAHLDAEGFVREVERYLGAGALDYALFNTARPDAETLARYAASGAAFLDPPTARRAKPRCILADLIDDAPFVRHGPREKLAASLLALVPKKKNAVSSKL